MKNKIFLLMITLLLCIGIYGYFNFTKNSKPVNQYNKRSTTVKNTNKENDSNLTYGIKLDDNTRDITSSVIDKDSNIKFIHNFDKDKMIIASDVSIASDKNKKVNVKIFNLSSGKTEKQLEIKLKNPVYNFMPLNKGFYIIDGNTMKRDETTFYHIYDNELKLEKTVDLSNLVRNVGYKSYILSNNGDKIAYIDDTDSKISSIYICNLDLKNRRKVYEVENNKVNKLANFDDIVFAENDKKIAFIGKIYINGNNWPQAFGTVNINGEEFNYKKHDGVSNIIQVSRGKTFFSDAETERGKDSSGQVFLEDNILNNVEEYSLKDKAESKSAYISDWGNFIVTCLGGKCQNNEPIYRFRIYDSKSKNIIKEMDTVFKEKDFLRCHIQEISICEERNSIYVAYKGDKEIKLYQYKLN